MTLRSRLSRWMKQDAVADAQRIPKRGEPWPGPVRKIFLLNDIITREIRPLLERDGGGIELVDLDGDTAIVRLKGHCGHCVCASATLKNLVEKKLRELVSPKITVKEA